MSDALCILKNLASATTCVLDIYVHRQLRYDMISSYFTRRSRQILQPEAVRAQTGLLEPTFFSSNAAIGACAKGHHWQQALGMLAEPSRAHEGHIQQQQ